MEPAETALKPGDAPRPDAAVSLAARVIEYGKESIVWIASIFFSSAAFFLLGWVITRIYHPDTKIYLLRAKELMAPVLDLEMVRPEPVERVLFLTGMVFLPVCLAAIYWLLSRWMARSSGRAYRLGLLVSSSAGVGLLAGLILFIFSIRTYYNSISNADTYLRQTILIRYPWVYCLVVFPLSLFLLYVLRVPESRWKKTTLNFLLAISAAFVFSVIFLMSVWGVEAVKNTVPFALHLNAVFASVVQVFNGSTLLVDGFANTYGLYPQFLLPLFRISGLSLVKFTALMGLLIAATFGIYFWVLAKIVRHRGIWFLGCAAIFFWGYIYSQIDIGDFFFQYYPLRTIFPALMLGIVAVYNQKEGRGWYLGGFLAGSLAFLWVPDVGAITYFSWFCFLVYREMFQPGWKPALRNTLAHVAVGLVTFGVVVGMYALLTRLTAGQYPDLARLFGMLGLFSGLGYYLLPMPPFHPWILAVLVFMVGLLYGIRAVLRREMDRRTNLVFYLTILGAGLLTYYQGRSHDWTFFSVMKDFLVLLPVYADDLWSALESLRWTKHNLFHLPLLLGLLTFALVVPFATLVIRAPDVFAVAFERGRIFQPQSTTAFMENLSFVRQHTAPGEKVLIFSGNQDIYEIEAGVDSAYPISLPDIAYKQEYTNLLQTVEDGKVKVFVEPDAMVEYLPILWDVNKILGDAYQLVDSNGKMSLYVKQ